MRWYSPGMLTVGLLLGSLTSRAIASPIPLKVNITGTSGDGSVSGYRLDGEYSLGRHLRDLHSATIMIHNDRIVDGSAKLLCVYKEP